MPFIVYKNLLIKFSNANSEDSEESNLSSDFPIYIWFVNINYASILLSWPIGFIITIISASNSYIGGFGVFVMGIVITYFLPVILGWVREVFLITLKTLLYLRIISKK